MPTKSLTTATADKAAAPVAPVAPVDAQGYTGRTNPLSAIMRMVTGKEPSPTESTELAKFLSGAVRLTDTHLYALAKFFSKRYHVQLSTLVLKIAKFQASQDENLSVQSAKAAIEAMIGVQIAEYDGIEGGFTNEYQSYFLEQVKAAHAALWDAYGKDGTVDAGLITRANAYDSETRAQRQSTMA